MDERDILFLETLTHKVVIKQNSGGIITAKTYERQGDGWKQVGLREYDNYAEFIETQSIEEMPGFDPLGELPRFEDEWM